MDVHPENQEKFSIFSLHSFKESFKVKPHRAKAKKIKEQLEKIKECAVKHQTIFSLSLSLGVGRPLAVKVKSETLYLALTRKTISRAEINVDRAAKQIKQQSEARKLQKHPNQFACCCLFLFNVIWSVFIQCISFCFYSMYFYLYLFTIFLSVFIHFIFYSKCFSADNTL